MASPNLFSWIAVIYLLAHGSLTINPFDRLTTSSMVKSRKSCSSSFVSSGFAATFATLVKINKVENRKIEVMIMLEVGVSESES